MRILITGGCGFLGQRLARTLLEKRTLALGGAPPAALSSILLTDQIAPSDALLRDERIDLIEGDLLQLIDAQRLPIDQMDAIFHLSSAVSGECEADFDLGLRSNLDATRALLEACRASRRVPLVIFSSSVAVFGGSPEQPLPAVILDETLPTPQNSYGIQKFICEQLVADYARKGFIRGRSVRLMTVSVRAGRPNGAASSFLSGLLREPLAAKRTRCPVPRQTAVALSSPARAIEGLVLAATCSDLQWGSRIALNLPALTTTIGEMVEALEKVAGRSAVERIDWQPDEDIMRIVGSWPSRIAAERAARLGLHADASIDALLAEYISEYPEAIKTPLVATTGR